MKIICATLFTALALLAYTPTRAQADTEITLDVFYEALQPQGDWIYVEDYGYCFRPFVSYDDESWQPYTEGYWSETEAGWTWVSEEDFGWATYHYGRWAQVGGYWCWVPGYDWAPAWVSWRKSPEYVGWAPLPPEARFEQNVGFHDWVDSYYDIGPTYYSFVSVRDFGAERCRTVLVDRHRNYDIIRGTTNITNISYRTNNVNVTNIYVGGPNFDEMNRFSERKIRRLSLRSDDRRDFSREDYRKGGYRNHIDKDSFTVFAPRVDRDKRDFVPTKLKARFDKDSIDRGWRGADENQRRDIRQKFDDDAKRGPEGRDRNTEDFRRSVTAAPVVAKAPSQDIPKGQIREGRGGPGGPGGRDGRPGDATASTDRRDGDRGPNAERGPDGKPIPRAEVMPEGRTDRPKDPAMAERDRDGNNRGRDGANTNRKPGEDQKETVMPAGRNDGDKTATTGRGERGPDGKPIPRAETVPDSRDGREGRMPNAQRPDETPGPNANRPDEPSGGPKREQNQNRDGREGRPAVPPRAEVVPEGRSNTPDKPDMERTRPGRPDGDSPRSTEPDKARTVVPAPERREARPEPQQVRPQVQPEQNRPRMDRPGEPERRPGGPDGDSRKRDGAGNSSNDDAQRAARQQQEAAAQSRARDQQQNQAREAMQRQQQPERREAPQQRPQVQPERRESPKPQVQQERREAPKPQAQPERREAPQQRPQPQVQPQQQRSDGPGGGGGGGKSRGKDDDDGKKKGRD